VGEGSPGQDSNPSTNEYKVHSMHKAVSIVFLVLVSSLFLPLANASKAPTFPHRAKFKDVPVMESAQLRDALDRVVIVDVRSRFEYQTLHIKGSVHIPLSKVKLPPAVKELRKQTDKPIVFYCNGTTCKKSYEAAKLALEAGVKNIYAYDAGIDHWTTLYPEASVLLGQSPVPASSFIDKAVFKSRVIGTEAFEAKIEQGAVVLDIRDLRQRDNPLFPMRENRAQLDETEKIAGIVNEAKRSKKPLLIYDKVGKQTRWFQYYLEQQGVKNYYFLDGGAEGYYEAKFGKAKFQVPDNS
jgi:rhodanese-related sulfurtransferase